MEMPDIRVHVLQRPDQVAAFWAWLTKPGREFLAVDIEATGLDWSAPGFKVRMVQVGDENSGWAIPFQDWRGLVQGAFDFMERARIDMVWYNIGYDSMGLRVEGISIDWSLVKDGFVLAALGGYCEEPRGLKENAVRELGAWAGLGQVVLKRGMANQGWTWETIPMGWRPYPLYGVVDTVITARLWRRWQKRYLQWQEMHDLEVSAMRITGNMSWHGLPVDIGYLDGKLAEVGAEEQGIVDRLKAKYGLNPSQPAAIIKTLDGLGLFGPDPVLTATGKKSVDEVALGRIDHEISRDVIRWRGLHGTRIKYLTKLRDKADADGLVHPGIKSMEAKTGRMSIEDPPMQQLPDDDMVRKAIIGRGEDHVVISCDWSQIELRIWASINGDAPLIQAIKDADNSVPKVDFFTSLCRSLYKEPGFAKGDHRRTKVKSSFYAKMFTGGIEVAAATAGVTISEMVPTWRTLGSAFESLDDLGRKLVKTGKDNGQQIWWIDSPFGRRFAARDRRQIRVLPNYDTQGTAAIALKKALVVMDALGIGDYLMLPVHDETLASAPKDEADDVQAVIAEAMNSILTEEEWGIGVPAEPHHGLNWAEAKAG